MYRRPDRPDVLDHESDQQTQGALTREMCAPSSVSCCPDHSDLVACESAGRRIVSTSAAARMTAPPIRSETKPPQPSHGPRRTMACLSHTQDLIDVRSVGVLPRKLLSALH
jgi:hypothetical protein